MASSSEGPPPPKEKSGLTVEIPGTPVGRAPSPGSKSPCPAPPLAGPHSPLPPFGTQSPLPPHGPGRMMFYPPHMGYPPGPYGNFPQPNPAFANKANGFGDQYPLYAQVPPGMYNAYQCRSRRPSCFRVFVILVLVLILGFFVLSYIMSASAFQYHELYYTVNSFTVSNFSATNSMLKSIWNTKISVRNPSLTTRVKVRNFTVTVIYRNTALKRSRGESFVVGIKMTEPMDVKTEFDASDQAQPQNAVFNRTVEQLGKDKDADGWVTFSLKLSGEAHYVTFLGFLTDQVRVECNDLKVQFKDNQGFFNDEGKPMECNIVQSTT